MTHDPTRDCEHGRLKGKCDVCDLQAEVDMLKGALKEWSDKTEWVQETAQPMELGMHRADVLRQRIERLKASIALDKKADNARELGLSYDDEPKIGCVNHDCDQCKAVQDSTCNETLRVQGKAYPRTCKKCGLGPCVGKPKSVTTPPAPQPVPVKTYHDGKPWPVAPKPWVGLDEDEVEDCARGCANHAELARAIEAKLKEKNT